MQRVGLAFLGLMTLAASSARANEYFALQTSISGAQTQIDSLHTSTWAFTTGLAWDFGGGTFVMKKGPSSAADVVLSIYQGTNFDAGSLVGSVSVTSSAFTQSFANVQFLFGTALALAPSSHFYVDLTSTANDTANVQYFIKGANSSLTFVDSNNNVIPAGYVTSVTDTSGTTTSGVPAPPVPEPVSISLMGVALGGLGVARVFRRNRRKA